MAIQDPTTNYSWNFPEEGDTNWGTTLETIIGDDSTGIDAVLGAVSVVANAALPKAGGAMTGRVDLFSATTKLTALGSISGANDINLSLSDSFSATITGATTFSFTNVPSGTWMTGFILFLTNGGTNVTWPDAVRDSAVVKKAYDECMKKHPEAAKVFDVAKVMIGMDLRRTCTASRPTGPRSASRSAS